MNAYSVNKLNISKITDDYAVAPQILPDDVAAIAAEGFVAIICNRPDGEDPGQPSAADIAAECANAGLLFHHIPVASMPLAEVDVKEQHRIIDASNGPVLGYCRSGQRSAIIWQAGC